MSELQQIIDLLNEQSQRQTEHYSKIQAKFGALKPVVESIHTSLTTLEETCEVVARDSAQARESCHRIRNLLSPLCMAVESLLEVAEGKTRSSDTLKSIHDQLREAIDAQR